MRVCATANETATVKKAAAAVTRRPSERLGIISKLHDCRPRYGFVRARASAMTSAAPPAIATNPSNGGIGSVRSRSAVA